MPIEADQDIITTIAVMKRPQLVRMLRGMKCGFKVHFSEKYVNSMSLDRLRHVALAASMHDKSFVV